ncbi:MAG TPA: hypothetical protein VEX13_05075 [Chloroflexia bacterium]|nr:hypothetical protein [Chloroflexia bacterium]
MAEEILVKEPFTKEMIEAGEAFKRILVNADFDLAAIFWLYTSEANKWRLLIASPQVDTEGPKRTYATIREILSEVSSEAPELDLWSITVLGSGETLVRTLAGANRHLGLSNKRLPGINLNGVYIEDIYVYCIADSVEPLRGSDWYI